MQECSWGEKKADWTFLYINHHRELLKRVFISAENLIWIGNYGHILYSLVEE